MKAQVYIDKAVAIREGLDNCGTYTIEFDPATLTQEQRDEMAMSISVKNGGAVTDVFDAMVGCNPNGNDFRADVAISAPTIENLIKLLDSRIQKRAEWVAKKENEAKESVADDLRRAIEWAAQPVEKRINKERVHSDAVGYCLSTPYLNNSTGGKYEENLRKIGETTPAVAAAIVEAEAYAKKAYDEDTLASKQRKAENERKAAEKKAEDEAIAAQMVAQFKTWVAENGTDNQKGRMKEGLLPDQEIIDAIRHEAYASLNDFSRYVKLKASDVCEGTEDWEDKKYHDVDFDSAPADKIDAEAYEILQKIRAAVPSAKVTPIIHTGKCDECETEVIRIGFMVQMTVGVLNFSREYGM